ncbi:MAG: response regulator [Myxococcota bacterium]|nr:response regulator [Myxococcota bacterium]
MPGISGIEVCKRLAEFHGSRDLPIIVFSTDDSLQTAAWNAGVRAFLKVPFSNIQLITLIRKLLTKVKTVLLVDDDSLIHHYVKRLLANQPYELVSTTNPLEVRELVELKRPDIILMDLNMPGARGDEVCSDLKADPGLCGIPIIICSVDGGDAALNTSFRAGADDYLMKPFEKGELLEKLQKAGRRKRRRQREMILVVEDSVVVRNLVVQGLSQAGFMVVSAGDGREALSILETSEVDLILTDLDMPLMSGRELTRQIRRSDKHSAKPILMLSADQDEISISREKSVGVDEFIRKPFEIDRLVILVEKMISEYHLRQEKIAIRRYLSDAAIEHGMQNWGSKEGGMRAENRFMTVFFVDIVGFTPMCERMDAHEVVSLLNGYFDTVVEVLRNNDAMIDKFIGDAIMALFGRIENGAYRAVKAGLEIVKAVERFNRDTGRRISVRVGINSGELVMGDIGSQHYRRDYTVIGDAVNVAQRLEQQADENSIFIGNETKELLGEVVKVQSQDAVSVKGRQEPVLCHRVVSLDDIDLV